MPDAWQHPGTSTDEGPHNICQGHGDLPVIGACFIALEPDLARLGPGVGLSLSSAAHAGRVALIWPARGRASLQGQERLKKGFVALEAVLPSRLDNPGTDRASDAQRDVQMAARHADSNLGDWTLGSEALEGGLSAGASTYVHSGQPARVLNA
jgi:hypothetical protein